MIIDNKPIEPKGQVRNSILEGLNKGLQKKDPFTQSKFESFNTGTKSGGLNSQRYYNHPAYNRLGFNPYIDNESVYNSNSSSWEDFKRAQGQWSNLFGLGFKTVFGGSSNIQESIDYEKASSIGSSSRGGATGMLTNAYLNSGYTVGLMSEIALEEIGMTALTFATGGATAEIQAARTAERVGALGRGISRGMNFLKNSTRTAERLKDLTSVAKAKTFYDRAKGIGNFINPLKGTTEFITNAATGKLDHLTDLAKVAKGFGSFYRDAREINLALDESSLESGFATKTVLNDLYDQYSKSHGGKGPEGEELDKIQRLAKQAGDATYLANAGLIYATNRLAFDGFFRRFAPKLGNSIVGSSDVGKLIFNRSAAKAGKGGFEVIEEGLKNQFKRSFSKAALKQSPIKVLKTLGSYTKTNFAEGIQEFGQEVIQDANVSRAKDSYYNALRGGYLDYYANSMSKYTSSEGLEIFGSGFIMGGIVGPMTRVASGGTQYLGKGVQKVFSPGKYKAQQDYKVAKLQAIQEQADKLNEMTSNPTKYFNMQSLDQLVDQTEIDNKAEVSATERKEKEFRDLKDEGIGKSLLYALKTGGYDNMLEQLQDMSNMSEEELHEAFGSEDNKEAIGSYKQNADEIITRAKAFKNIYDSVNNNFSNPYNNDVPNIGDVTEEDGYISEKLKYYAFEAAKEEVILNQFNFKRTLERTQAIVQDIKNNSAFWSNSNVSTTDIELLTNYPRIGDEIKLLTEELKNTVPDQYNSEEIKFKKQKLKSLESFNRTLEGLRNAYINEKEVSETINNIKKNSIYVGTIVNVNTKKGGSSKIVGEATTKAGKSAWLLEDGRTVLKDKVSAEGLKYQEEIIDPITEDLKKDFDKYLQTIANNKSDFVDNDKANSLFRKLLDLYALDQDGKNLSESISQLTNPKGFTNLVNRHNKILQYKWENRQEDLKNSLEAFYKASEDNELLQNLAKDHNVFILEEDLEDLLDDNIIPEYIYDINTLKEVPNDTEKYIQVKKDITDFLVSTGRIPSQVEEDAAEIVNEQEIDVPQSVEQLTINSLFEGVDDEGNSTWPEEVSIPILDSFNTSNVTKQANGFPASTLKEWMLTPSGTSAINKILDVYNDKVIPVAEVKVESNNIKPQVNKVNEQGDIEVITTDQEYYDASIDDQSTPVERNVVDIKLNSISTNSILQGNKSIELFTNDEAVKLGLANPLNSANFFINNDRYLLLSKGFLTVQEAGGVNSVINQLGLPTSSVEDYNEPITVNNITYYSNNANIIKWLNGQGKMTIVDIKADPEIVQVEVNEYQAIMSFDNKFISKINKASSIEELANIEIDLIAESNQFYKQTGILLDNTLGNLIGQRFNQIQNDISIDNINVGEILVLKGKMANFGTVKVNSKGTTQQGLKYIRVKSITSPELDETSINDYQTKNMISQKGVTPITGSELSEVEKEIVMENLKNQDKTTELQDQIKEAITEAEKQSADEIEDEFTNSLGCK